MAKATIERVKKYICPLCGTTGLKSKRGLRKHCDHVHKGITREAFEAAWAASVKEFEARVPKKSSGQQTASQAPRTRNSQPARKMVKFQGQEPAKEVPKAPSAPPKATKPPPKATEPPPKAAKAPKKHLRPVPSPPVGAQAPSEPLTGVLSIPKGSRLLIDGDIYYQAETGFLPVKVERVAMTVGLRQAEPDGRNWLFCKVDGVTYGLDERLVLSGAHQLVSLPPPVVVPDGPPITTSEVEEPPANIEYRTQLPEYVEAIKAYHAVKEQELAISKLLKAAKNEHYDNIYNFTMAHGTESEPNKLDYVLCEGGYRAWLFRTPGRTQYKYNEPAIIQWCIDKGHEEVLRRALDVQAWVKLVESGVVPQTTVDLYTTKIDVPDTFRLSLMKEEEDK